MTTKERLRDIELANDTHKPVGAFTVELCDPRTGKVLDRQRKNNYITPVYERLVRWYQGAMFHQGMPMVSNGVVDHRFSEVTGGYKELAFPPQLPIEGMFALDSSIAENTASDWATGRTIGYGYRWKGADVPTSGKRGQLNDTQCLISRDLVRLVWDFNENQGNGTFASLCIGRGDELGNLMCAYSQDGSYIVNGNDDNTLYADPSWTLYRPHIAGADANNVYVVYSAPSTTTIRIATLPWASFTDTSRFTDALVKEYAGATPTEVVLSGQVVASNSSDTNTRHHYFTNTAVAKEGTNWIVAHQGGGNTLYLSRFNSSGTRTHNLTVTTNSVFEDASNLAVSIVGTNAYITTNMDDGTPANNRDIYRVDLTSFTLSATIPLAGTAIVTGTSCVIGSDIYVQTNEGIHRYQTSDGAFVECYGSPSTPGWQEQGLAPFNTTTGPDNYGFDALWLRNTLWLYRGHIAASTNSDMFSGFYAPQMGNLMSTGLGTSAMILTNGTKLFAFNGASPSSATDDRFIHPLVGANAFSRSVLEAPINKTASSTMKWTYELTLPASWYAAEPHNAPPSP